MTSKVIQGHWKLHESIGHMALPCAMCSNNVSIYLHHFLDTTIFTVCVTACNLVKSFILEKRSRLKATDAFQFICIQNVVKTSNISW